MAGGDELGRSFLLPSSEVEGSGPSFAGVTEKWKADGGWEGTQRCPELHWWHLNACNYGKLAELAKRLFALQASSAGGERLFSRTGRLCSPLRNRLSGRSIKELQMIADHYHDGLLKVEGYTTERAKKRDATGASKAAAAAEKAGDSEAEVEVVGSSGRKQLQPKVRREDMTPDLEAVPEVVDEDMSGFVVGGRQAGIQHRVSQALAQASWGAYYSAWHYDSLHQTNAWQVAQQATYTVQRVEIQFEKPTVLTEI